MNKKRYAGPLWTSTVKHDYIDSKGLETVRRDNCRLAKDIIGTALDKILLDRSPEKAIEYVQHKVGLLLQNKIDISDLVVTKGLTKTADQYKGTKQAHVELAARMKQRDAGSAPNVGDRVAYVSIKGTKGQKAYELAEDPLYVLDNDIPIDANWYVEHQLREPLLRIFNPVIPNAATALFAGDHTRKVYKATNNAGSIMKFATKSLQCLGCRALLAKGDEGALCKACLPMQPAIYAGRVGAVASLERQTNALWTNCQRCQASNMNDILCNNSDCDYYYRRIKAAKDLERARAHVARFGDPTW